MEKLIVFGRGKFCKTKLDSLKNEFQIICIIDNSIENHTYDENYGYDVYNPKVITKYGDCKVICMSIYCVDMYKQLKKLGVEDKQILFGFNYAPHYNGLDQIAFEHEEKIAINNGKLEYIDNEENHYKFSSLEELREIIRSIFRKKNPIIQSIAKMPVEPVSRVFGLERGQAVDRYYIENFLELYKEDIKGEVMEIDSNLYTRRYGGDKVTKEIKLHVFGWNGAIKGNFETGEGLSDEMVDCLICTQTLQFIYDVESAIKNIYKILKPSGVALITIPGIKHLSVYDDNNFGEKWSFTEKSICILGEKFFGKENCIVNTYGNVKIVTAYLNGLCYEDLKMEDFLYNDKQFPFLITARLKK